jgi:rhamnulose-1-phosphate aldolase
MVRLSPEDVEFDTLDDVLNSIGAAGARLSAIEASEGAAGNISVLYGWNKWADARFSEYWEIPSPVPVPSLSEAWLAVTGSGRRLREVQHSVGANVALVHVLEGGQMLGIHASPSKLFQKPTSELNTHLALHAKHAVKEGPVHTVIHAQPLHLTFLSHMAQCSDTPGMNSHVLRWHPELIHHLHDGIGVAPLLVPGSDALMRATVELSERHRVVIWSRHGAIARVSGSIKRACDLIEYAETGARYEFMNLQCGGKAEPISVAALLRICKELGVEQTAFPT